MRVGKKEIYYFVLPAISFLIIFSIYPTIYTWYISFRDFTMFGDNFTGIRNYVRLFTSTIFPRLIYNTLFYVIIAVILEFVFGLGIAILFNQHFKGKSIALVFLMLPMIIPPVVSALSFFMLYDPTLGFANYLLNTLFNIQGAAWFTDPSTALWAVVSVDVWQWTPFMALILLAGLQYIPKEVMEAARIDGANTFAIFYYIIIRIMKKVIIIAVMFRTVEAFKAFESIYITTRGGPGNVTRTLNIHSYLTAFNFMRFGEAAAIAIIMLFISAFLLTFLSKAMREEA